MEHEVTVCCLGDRPGTPSDEGEVAVSVDGRTLVEPWRCAGSGGTSVGSEFVDLNSRPFVIRSS